MAIVYNVQIHPIHAGHVNDHKVIREEEFNTREDALMWAEFYNQHRVRWNIDNVVAVYTGAIDTETGENP